jgi:tyrosine-protein kinase Fer
MGFSSQGKGVHEALLARQDGEIRLIEIMRKCLQQKSKSDRDYAAAMSSVAQLGLKIDRTDDLAGEFIVFFLSFMPLANFTLIDLN